MTPLSKITIRMVKTTRTELDDVIGREYRLNEAGDQEVNIQVYRDGRKVWAVRAEQSYGDSVKVQTQAVTISDWSDISAVEETLAEVKEYIAVGQIFAPRTENGWTAREDGWNITEEC